MQKENINALALPRQITVDNYIIRQAENCHVTIFDTNSGKMVFHGQCIEKFDDKKLKGVLEFYLKIGKNGVKINSKSNN